MANRRGGSDPSSWPSSRYRRREKGKTFLSPSPVRGSSGGSGTMANRRADSPPSSRPSSRYRRREKEKTFLSPSPASGAGRFGPAGVGVRDRGGRLGRDGSLGKKALFCLAEERATGGSGTMANRRGGSDPSSRPSSRYRRREKEKTFLSPSPASGAGRFGPAGVGVRDRGGRLGRGRSLAKRRYFASPRRGLLAA
jgi:hypothetical protein